MITRKIGQIDLMIDITKSSSIYTNRDVAKLIEDANGSLDKIKDVIYESVGGYIPLAMTWELTNNCNFNCPFCYIHNADENSMIRFRTVKNDIDYLIEKGLFICYLSGGEALSHPDFFDIYRFLKERGVLVAILTNCSLLNDDHIQLFSEYPPYKVVVSLYGISNSQFFSATAQKTVTPDRILDNVIKLKNAGIKVRCQSPMNQLTFTEFEEIAEWCELNNISYSASDELLESYSNKSNQEYVIDNEIFQLKKKGIHRVGIVKNDEVDTPSDKIMHKRHFDCKAGKHSLILSYNHKLRPCFVLYGDTYPEFDANNSMVEALEQMKTYIQEQQSLIIEYCYGCYASSVCTECSYTQSKASDLKSYMESKCAQNRETVVQNG